jgi:hypothetical protein
MCAFLSKKSAFVYFASPYRSDLQGIQLTNGLLEYLPAVSLLRDDDGQITGSSGFLGDVVSVLQQQLNFAVTTILPPDGKWGGSKENGIGWTGLVGLLEEKKADFVAAPLSKTLDRHKVARVVVSFFGQKYSRTISLFQTLASMMVSDKPESFANFPTYKRGTIKIY